MIQVYAPASIGNIGVGFDVLGMAIKPINDSLLGDCISIEDSDHFTIKSEGLFYDQLPIVLEQNIIFRCWKKFCEILGKTIPLAIKLKKNVPIASGLGSSACSIVASLVAMNCYRGYPLSNNQLLMLMGEMESVVSGSVHLDNVIPCFLGGMRLILPEFSNNFSQVIPGFDDWIWIVAYPGVKISTEKSRSILPNKYSLQDCIKHSRYLSGFIHACHTNQEVLAAQCMQDVIAEPYRSKLLPVDLSYVKDSLMKQGAISCGISGSGPTIFVLCNNTDNVINDISNWLSCFYLQNDSGFVKVCRLNNLGTCVITE